MASRAIVRRRKRLLDNVNAPILSSSFPTFQHGTFGFKAQPRIAPQFLEQSLGDSKSDKEKEQYNVNLTKGGLLGLGNGFPQRPAHVISLHGYGIGRSNEFALPFGARGLLQSVRRASTATAGQPKLDIEEEQSEDQKQNKKKKEASPEECDQAVEGLSTAKAKAKAKQVQESLKASRSIVQKFWARLLGIGPALQAIASMSRADWAVKLKHGKDEFISRLQHYWLGTKLLWADVRISSRLLVKLAGGKSLSRRERQQLTRTTADIFRLVPVAVFIVVPFMEFLLPVFLKLFPNMLPSTFQDKMKEEEALKRKLKARMEYAKFLQEPAKEMAKEVKASYSGETKQTAGDLDEFLNKDVTNVGDEGSFAPNIQENKDGLELLKTAIEKAGYTGKVVIGMDVAASEFYNDKDKTYDLNFKEEISGDSLKNVYKSFVSEYPIGLIKDPVEQDDWMHYAKMTEECGESLDYDHLVNKQMDHVLKASSQDKPELTLNRVKVFQNGRTFSSIGLEPEPEVPVVKQLMFCDDYEAQQWPLFPLKDCLTAGSILKPISPDGLFRKVDLQVFGNSVLGELGFGLLRHGSGLVTVNKMRGVNVSQLLKIDNLLWSPGLRGIMFKSTCITDEEASKEKKTDEEASEEEKTDEECPYNALRVLFYECLEVSRGQTAESLKLPLDVMHLLYYLECATSVDKRLINNHSAIRFPGDRIFRNGAANRFLRHTVVSRLKRMRSGYCQDSIGAHNLEARVNRVFIDLSEVFPEKLFDPAGLHPVVNYWVREGQTLRGIKKTADSAPLERPFSADGKKIKVGSTEEKVELGKISVALHRDPFEHLYGPARLWQREYSVYHVEELINKVDPGYGPVLEKSFLRHGFWRELDMDQNRPSHCYFTDVSWERSPRVE